MTCIVGVVSESGQVVIAGDSSSVEADSVRVVRNPKVFQLGLEFVFGYAGSFRVGQIIQYSFIPPLQKVGQDVMEYLVNDFCEALRLTLEDKGAIIGRTGTDEMEADLLIGYRGRLFQVDGDFQFTEFKHNYAAIGSGSEVAVGALAASSRVRSATKRARLALEASALHCSGVCAPFHLVVHKV